jgi:acetyl-CoA synthetase
LVYAVCQAGEPASQQTLENLKSEMNTALKQQLNPLFRVAELEVVDALPRTASGKVMRRKLRS